ASSARATIDAATYTYKVGRVARDRAPFVRNGLEGDPEFDQEWVAREKIVAAGVFPMLIAGELRGVLAHFSRQSLPDEVVEALTAFVAIVTSSLNDVQLFASEQAAREEAEAQGRKLQTILDMLPV